MCGGLRHQRKCWLDQEAWGHEADGLQAQAFQHMQLKHMRWRRVGTVTLQAICSPQQRLVIKQDMNSFGDSPDDCGEKEIAGSETDEVSGCLQL